MSQSPTETRPCAAYAEDYHDENQCAVPGTRTSSQMRQPKNPKRDEASDSGYASTSGSRKILKVIGKVTRSKKSSKETMAPPATAPKKTVTKVAAMQNLRINTTKPPESREDAARIHLSGEPIRRTVSNKSQENPVHVLRSAKIGPPPAPIPIRLVPTAPRTGLIRPNSYHAGAPEYWSASHSVHFPAPIPVPRQMPVHQPPPTLSHSYQPPVMYPAPTSPGRPIAYPFMPTVPPPPPPSSWVPQPSLVRRYSVAGPPTAPLGVEYPMVPRPVVYQHYIEHPRPPVFQEPQVPYHQVVQDEALLLEDSEAYYRHQHQEQLRRAMPPPPLPQRPTIRHAATIATAPVVRTNRGSVDYGLTPTSSRGSFSSIRDQHRGPPMVRTSSRDEQIRRSEIPASADNTRRSRPKSLYASWDREQAAKQYQTEAGSDELQSLTIDAIQKVNRSSKSQKSRASEAGSRSSGTKKVREAKKAQPEAVSVSVNQGCTATVIRDAHGLSVHVQPCEENKERPGRQVEREELPHRHSVSTRRESLTEVARSILPRRPSSSQPTMRRERIEPLRTIDVEKRLTDKMREPDDTAVEDDEYSETEVPKKRGERLTAQRLARMKSPTESRPSSRGARSVKSAKSTASSRRGIPVERPHS